MDLRIEVVTVTEWQQNCSILCPADGGPAVLIDPASGNRIAGADPRRDCYAMAY